MLGGLLPQRSVATALNYTRLPVARALNKARWSVATALNFAMRPVATTLNYARRPIAACCQGHKLCKSWHITTVVLTDNEISTMSTLMNVDRR